MKKMTWLNNATLRW